MDSDVGETDRMGCIEDIQDENVLREMWMEALDAEAKRLIRSRMYKLREQRLKDLYNREGILENILKNDGDEVDNSLTSISKTQVSNLDDEEIGNEKVTKPRVNTEAVKTKINQSDRSRQYDEIKKEIRQCNSVKTETEGISSNPKKANVSPTTLKPSSGGTNNENGVQRSRGGRTSPSKPKVSLTERGQNIQNQQHRETTEEKGVSGGSTGVISKKVVKGMLSPLSKKRSRIGPSGDESISPHPIPSPCPTPRFMSSTKSRDNAFVPNPNTNSRESGRVAMKTSPNLIEKQTKGKLSGSHPKTPGTHSEVIALSQDESLDSRKKEKLVSANQSTFQKDKSPSFLIDKLEKSNTEDYIIRELDILDSYLAQRSTSIDEKIPQQLTIIESGGNSIDPKGTMNKKLGKDKGGVSKGLPSPKSKKLMDVQDSGLEPIATRTFHKYGHVEPTGSNSKDREILPSAVIGLKIKAKGSKGDSSKVVPTVPKKPTTDTTLSKYEEDILSRSSIFEKYERIRSSSQSPRSSVEKSTGHKIVKKSGVDYYKSSTEDLDDLESSYNKKGSFSGNLESPGAVLKAKSMFEGRAVESSKDKASGGFQSVGPINKVTKNMAMFEARSRGERVSISSDSSHATFSDTRDGLTSTEIQLPIGIGHPGSDSNETTGNEILNLEQFSKYETPEYKPMTPFSTRHVRQKSPSKSENTDKDEMSPILQKKAIKSNSKVLEAKVETMLRRSTEVAKPTRLSLEYIQSIDDVIILDQLLEEATSYDERSNIRARVRELKRSKTLNTGTSSVPPEPVLTLPFMFDALKIQKSYGGKGIFQDNSGGGIMSVKKLHVRPRKPYSHSPELKQRVSKIKSSDIPEFPAEVDSKIMKDRAKGSPVLVGRISPSPTPQAKLPKDTKSGNEQAEERLNTSGRVPGRSIPRPLNFKKDMKPTDGNANVPDQTIPSLSIKTSNLEKSQSLDTEETKNVLSQMKPRRKSAAEPPKVFYQLLPIDKQSNFVRQMFSTIPSKKEENMNTAALVSEPNPIVEPKPRPASKLPEKLKDIITKQKPKSYIVAHATIDPPTTAFERMLNKLDMVTSSYGVGPTDEDGKPLFGLKALKKAKELQEQNNNCNSNRNEIEKDGCNGRKYHGDIRLSDIFGLRALRKMSHAEVESHSITSSAPHGLDIGQGAGEDTKLKPKSILKKTSSFSSNSSESKPDINFIVVGPEGNSDDGVMSPNSATNNVISSMSITNRTELTSSLPHLTEGKRTGSTHSTDWKKKSTEPITTDSNNSLSSSLSRGRVGRSSVREMSKKFETTNQEDENEVNVPITLSTTSLFRDTDRNDQSQRPEGSGRNFLTDKSPVAGISDILDRMKWNSGPTDDNNGEMGLLNKFIGAQILMQGIEPMLSTKTVTTTTMSRSLILKGVDVDLEEDIAKLKNLLDDCKDDDARLRIEHRLQALGTVGASVSMSKKGTRSADVTVESKMAKTNISGDSKSTEVAAMKTSKSAKQSKEVEKSASVQESKTPTGTTTVCVQKQSSVSKSSFSTSSMTTSEKVTSTSTTSPFSKFKQLDDQNSSGKHSTTGKPVFVFTNPGLKSSVNSTKDALLLWCQSRTREYQNVKIENFSSSWSDGLAFCALLHHFFKDSFDYDSLTPTNRKKNFELAFRIAEEKGGVYPLLDPEDMVAMGNRPDWKCVFTYIQAIYHKLKSQ